MRLSTTGAFVRALRKASLQGQRNSDVLHPSLCLARGLNNAAASTSPESYPEQSVRPEDEVDPSKTSASVAAPTYGDRHEAQAAFLEELRSSKNENKIVRQRLLAGAKIAGSPYIFDRTTNLSSSILRNIGRNLYNLPNHPICITRKLIESVFAPPVFKNHTNPNPVVTVEENFDLLGFPPDHPGRSRTDTYYVDSTRVLRTHTSAHEDAAFKYMQSHPERGYTICADVYRRDAIDRSHFPVFHQMEGARTWALPSAATRTKQIFARIKKIEHDLATLPETHVVVKEAAPLFSATTNPIQTEHDPNESKLITQHLRKSLELVVNRIFNAARAAGVGSEAERAQPLEIRWIEAYFPFTSPSYELEVFWQGEWLELLGCGVTQQPILNSAGLHDRIGWAWGIGIERLAMVLFGIPDIRLFWSTDSRFLDQFSQGKITRFEPFSKFPACYKDVAFWISSSPGNASPLNANINHSSGLARAAGGDSTRASPTDTQPAAFHENDVMEVVRDVAGELVEEVKLIDEFVHAASGRKSLCYRINYRSFERTLTNEEANAVHGRVVERIRDTLNVTIRDGQKLR